MFYRRFRTLADQVLAFTGHGTAAWNGASIAARAATTPNPPVGPASQPEDATRSAGSIPGAAPASQAAG